jgi:hypothetical protein
VRRRAGSMPSACEGGKRAALSGKSPSGFGQLWKFGEGVFVLNHMKR